MLNCHYLLQDFSAVMHVSLFLTLTCLSLYSTYLVIWVDYLSFIVNGFFYGYEFLSVFNQPF